MSGKFHEDQTLKTKDSGSAGVLLDKDVDYIWMFQKIVVPPNHPF